MGGGSCPITSTPLVCVGFVGLGLAVLSRAFNKPYICFCLNQFICWNTLPHSALQRRRSQAAMVEFTGFLLLGVAGTVDCEARILLFVLAVPIICVGLALYMKTLKAFRHMSQRVINAFKHSNRLYCCCPRETRTRIRQQQLLWNLAVRLTESLPEDGLVSPAFATAPEPPLKDKAAAAASEHPEKPGYTSVPATAVAIGAEPSLYGFTVKRIVKPHRCFLGVCGPRIYTPECPLLLVDSVKSWMLPQAAASSTVGVPFTRLVVLNADNPLLLDLARVVDEMATVDPERCTEFCEQVACLLVDLVQWPVCLPISQMGGFGGSDVGYDSYHEEEPKLVVPTVLAQEHMWSAGVAASTYGYPRKRLREALAAEVRHFLLHPSQVPIAAITLPSGEDDAVVNTPSAPPTGHVLGSELLQYSPQFARLVGGRPMPDPNENLHFALCLVLKVPIVDRTGVIQDPLVRVKVVDPVPPARTSRSLPRICDNYRSTTQGNAALHVALPWHVLHKSYDPKSSAKTWADKSGLTEAITDRAEELVARALGTEARRLDVLWSGGIDSTTVLVAIMQAMEKNALSTDLELRVLFSARSVEEWPAFAQAYLQVGYSVCGTCKQDARPPQTLPAVKFSSKFHALQLHPVLLSPSENEAISDFIDLTSGLTVTGEYGDQIFGSILMAGAFSKKASFIYPMEHEQPDVLDSGWQSPVEAYVRSLNILREDKIKELMALLETQALEAPFAIVSVFDWLWWVNFTMKWQYVGLRMLNRVESLDATKAARLVHFFGTVKFQQWALDGECHKFFKMPLMANNRLPTGKHRWANYKALLKAYIADNCPKVSDCGIYFRFKVKEGSLRHQPSRHFAMDDQYNILTFGGHSISQSNLKAAYGDTLERFLK